MIHLSGQNAQYNILTITKAHVATMIRHEKRTDMQNNYISSRSVSVHIIGKYEFESELEWFIQGVNPFEVEILFNQISSWNY